MTKPAQVFLLSPANCAGARARQVMAESAAFPLAERLRSPAGAPLGEVFSFVSGLYFRGKLTYALTFARPPEGRFACGVFVITPNAGLVPAHQAVRIDAIRAFAEGRVDPRDAVYRATLAASAARLARRIGRRDRVVLLGSLATPKYLEILGAVFGARLCYPAAFLGLGDMQRGSLMLRYAREGRELAYVSLPRA